YGAQIYAALRHAVPDLDTRLAKGDALFALDWLRQHMYVYGATYRPAELIQRVTGETPNPKYFADYLTRKFAEVCGLPRESASPVLDGHSQQRRLVHPLDRTGGGPAEAWSWMWRVRRRGG